MFDYDDKKPQYFAGPRKEMLPFIPSGAKRILEIDPAAVSRTSDCC